MDAVRLLIVDDSNMMRTRIARVVQAGGLPPVQVVGMARNGVEALRLVRTTQPELVTMDLTMPEMDGVDTIREIVVQAPRTNILVVSALADKSTAIQALRLGARGFVAKPFTDQQLQLALLELMEPR
jgi:two-component system chemotaxis response regulator CheY